MPLFEAMGDAFGEAFATLHKANVDPYVFLDTMVALFGSPVYANYGYMIAGFALPLGLKDVRLMLETAQECDWSSVAKVSRWNAGL